MTSRHVNSVLLAAGMSLFKGQCLIAHTYMATFDGSLPARMNPTLWYCTPHQTNKEYRLTP